ncbi:hypothetical protein P3X46_012958 [Hevea brasiliensis]|uniref:VQ domain-containing protein n=1 Tax=Hevea brasiliensis TaxID=3981 RepID=A0ABQ9MEJ8_HEVBR|nr:protein MKS1 [Hevea brasiliensis]KAJ9177785.1 hypothetical protein P3X46_012958 [Hevea brasiliensis]
MDPSGFATGGNLPPPPGRSKPQQPPPLQPSSSQSPTKKQNQIQGLRPPALKLHQVSNKIKKPPRPPAQQQPVIIYAVSPKIIHTEVSEFMAVVQRLTGLSSGDFSGDGEVSPEARLAATEKASPRERSSTSIEERNDLMDMLEGVEIGQIPGILSPAPAMLSPVPSGFFSPVTDPKFFYDMSSPYGSNSFIYSPSGLLSAPMFSPLPSPDIFNLFMDHEEEKREEGEEEEEEEEG